MIFFYDECFLVMLLLGKEIIVYGLKLKLIKCVNYVFGDIIVIVDN